MIEIGVVIPLKHSHKIQGCDSSLFVLFNGLLQLSKVASLHEAILLSINLGTLVVHIYLVEDVVSNALCMDDESSLGELIRDIRFMVLRVVIRGPALLNLG